MAVQLLEDWLLKEQEKMQAKYRELNQISPRDPDIIFIGDSIIEYYPIHELLQTSKYMVNRGIRGYKTDLLMDNLDAHVFGIGIDQIFLLIGTNDIGKGVSLDQTIAHMEAIIQQLSRDLPLTKIKLISVLPVNESELYKSTVYIRRNQVIKTLNQAYRELSECYLNVQFIDVFDDLADGEGQLKEEYTTDGLHLSVEGYRMLSKQLQKELE